MPGQKLVYISPDAHRRLKLLAARRSRTMGEMVAQLVERRTDGSFQCLDEYRRAEAAGTDAGESLGRSSLECL